MSRLQALLKDLTASKLELESKLQDKDCELKQTQARAVLNGQRAVYAWLGFERDLLRCFATSQGSYYEQMFFFFLSCLQASVKDKEGQLKERDGELMEAVAALEIMEAQDMP